MFRPRNSPDWSLSCSLKRCVLPGPACQPRTRLLQVLEVTARWTTADGPETRGSSQKLKQEQQLDREERNHRESVLIQPDQRQCFLPPQNFGSAF